MNNVPQPKQSVIDLYLPDRDTGKTVVPKLPADWVDWFLGAQIAKTRVQKGKNIGHSLPALAFVAATGATPIEIASGIKIKVSSADEIAILIGGSTLPEKKALQPRILVFNRNNHVNLAVDYLINSYCRPQTVGRTYVFTYKQDRLSKLVNDLAKEFIEKKIPNRQREGIRISSSTFRHQISADLCASGRYEAIEIASILGLRKTSSLRGYALKSKSTARSLRTVECYVPKKTLETGGV